MSVQYDNNDRSSAASGRNGPNVALILSAVLAVVAVVFFLANSKQIEVNFLLFKRTTTVRWSILVAVILGIVIDRLFSIWWRRRRKD